MSDFVDQCRREWKRLRVPDPVAEEMAADLAADLREAEADGVSAEELLGSSVFDPRSFAASWAAERGVIPGAPRRATAARKPLALLALAAVFALASIVGEGSIYPLLGRLEREGFVESYRAASDGGPPRKYYRPSGEGRRVLAAGGSEWRAVRDAVDAVLAPVEVEVMA